MSDVQCRWLHVWPVAMNALPQPFAKIHVTHDVGLLDTDSPQSTNEGYLVSRQDRAGIVLSLCAPRPDLVCVGDVLSPRTPLQIVGTVVSFVPVLVVYFDVSVWVWDKGFRDKCVYLLLHCYGATIQYNSQITSRRPARPKQPTNVIGIHPTKIADSVPLAGYPVYPVNLFPCFRRCLCQCVPAHVSPMLYSPSNGTFSLKNSPARLMLSTPSRPT